MYAHKSIYIYISKLCLLKVLRSNHISLAMRPSSQILASKNHSPIKGTMALLGEVAESKTGQRKYIVLYVYMEHHQVPERKKVLKRKLKRGDVKAKRHGTNQKEPPEFKAGTTGATK